VITFAQLKQHPELLTPEVHSPIFHSNGTMTIIWEGDPSQEGLMYVGEWMEKPEPLEHIPNTGIWGIDAPAPLLPRTVCSYVAVGNDREALPSPRHQRDLFGPDLPPLPIAEGDPSALAEEVTLPAPGLAGNERRVRILLPPGYTKEQTYHTLYLTDGQMEIDQEKRFPAVTDTLRQRGEMPPVILVAMDNGGRERPEEYLIGGSRNLAARAWVWETVVPYVDARYPAAGRWAVGGSNGGSMAAQLVLGRPDLFSGGAFYSPWHRGGLEDILRVADAWPGGGRVAISHGTFGLGEQKNLPGARALVEHLRARGAQVHFLELEGYGHNFAAWHRAMPLLLRWLLSYV
jgi:enterochelin esterase-like enzyme